MAFDAGGCVSSKNSGSSFDITSQSNQLRNRREWLRVLPSRRKRQQLSGLDLEALPANVVQFLASCELEVLGQPLFFGHRHQARGSILHLGEGVDGFLAQTDIARCICDNWLQQPDDGFIACISERFDYIGCAGISQCAVQQLAISIV